MAHNRQFSTGATRNDDETKIDPEGFNSPLVDLFYAEYMHKHRINPDTGTLRDSDNWQRGIPLDSYAKSHCRHSLDFRLLHRGYEGIETQDIKDALCGIIFNAKGYLFELLKRENENGSSNDGINSSDSYSSNNRVDTAVPTCWSLGPECDGVSVGACGGCDHHCICRAMHVASCNLLAQAYCLNACCTTKYEIHHGHGRHART